MHGVLASAALIAAHGQATGRVAGPDQVARAFLEAVTREQWIEAALLMDARYVEQMRSSIMRSLRRGPRQFDPKEYDLAFAGVTDTAAFVRLTSLELAARYVEAKDARYTASHDVTPTRACQPGTPVANT